MALGPYPEKSWSLSKHREFIECRRKYFFSTFEQWGGWELTAPESKQKAYRLKKLSSLHAFLGTLVHREIAGALRGSLLTLDESLSRIKKSLLKGFDDSIKRAASWEMDPKNVIMFQEVYYQREKWDQEAVTLAVEELLDKARICLNNFMISDSLKLLKIEKCLPIEVEDRFPSFNLNGLKVFSIVDLLFKRSKGSFWIIDWKTGKPDGENDSRQLKLYSMYVSNRYCAKIEDIHCTDEFLLEGEKIDHSFTEEDISVEKQRIIFSNKKMEEYLEDVGLNKPKDVSQFPKKNDDNCHYCQFREICS